VRADGVTIEKSAQLLKPDSRVDYAPAHPYVSRGALKLAAALDHFSLSPEGLVCLDVGASTGGFTEILLTRGATRVYAVDVGHGQLHPKLAGDERVVSIEGMNARALSRENIGAAPHFIVADVSFISLKLALPRALEIAKPGARLVALVKPQFEVGRERLGKNGIVRSEADRRVAVDSIATWLSSDQGWIVDGTMDSPIEGGDGNREFLIAARKP
jgi:23S rRNA (cytidine1920-2'-O)/16S rRNA (cytidine1409-2'-O)-methyltransferase